MKRYISAFLVPCLLLQLCGCYSTKYLSSEELRYNYSYDPITISTIDGKEFVIKKNITINEIEKDTTTIYCSDFYWLNDSLILSKATAELSNQVDVNGNKMKVIKAERVIISKNSINKISSSEYNSPDNTVIMIAVAGIVVIAIIALVIYNSIYSSELKAK